MKVSPVRQLVTVAAGQGSVGTAYFSTLAIAVMVCEESVERYFMALTLWMA